MNIFIQIGIGIAICVLIVWLSSVVSQAIKSAYDKGFVKGREHGEKMNPDAGKLRAEAIQRGYAKWVVINTNTGETIFKWLN